MRLGRWILGAAIVGLVVLAAGAYTYRTVPEATLPENAPVDALLVLGAPANFDGTPTYGQIWRTDEAIREFRAGRAPRILFTGGATMRDFVEADVMARYAEEHGIPPVAILRERTSRTTLQNLRNAQVVLDAHGWRRVEVISSPEHLRRTAVLLGYTHLQWRTHAAPNPGRNRVTVATAYTQEAIGTVVFRWFGPHAEPVLHAAAAVQRAVGYGWRWCRYRLDEALHPKPR